MVDVPYTYDRAYDETLEQETGYPWNGDIRLKITQGNQDFTMKLRIPGWVRGNVLPGDLYSYADNQKPAYQVSVNGQTVESDVNDGYLSIARKWKKGDQVKIHFDMEPRTVKANNKVEADQMIFLVAQRDVQCDEPKKADLYSVGTVAYVRQILRLPGDNMRILVEGKYRAQLTDMIHAEPYLFARAMELDEPGYHAAVPRTQALVRQAHQLFEQFIDLAVKSGQENLLQGSSTDDAGELADFIAQNATFGYEDKQRVLETLPPVHRLELCIRMMAKELDILRLESEINDQVQQNVNQNQRDYYLREQLHVIREELGEDDDMQLRLPLRLLADFRFI